MPMRVCAIAVIDRAKRNTPNRCLHIHANEKHFVSELHAIRNVLLQLVAQQLILRYRRTVLGYLWTLINPLLMMTVMALDFRPCIGSIFVFCDFFVRGNDPLEFLQFSGDAVGDVLH